MSLGKQAKVLTKAQVDAALNYLGKTRHPERNRLDLPALGPKLDSEQRRWHACRRPLDIPLVVQWWKCDRANT
jgi:hypothetical protein